MLRSVIPRLLTFEFISFILFHLLHNSILKLLKLPVNAFGLLIMSIIQHQFHLTGRFPLHDGLHLIGGNSDGVAGQFQIRIAQPGNIEWSHTAFAVPRKQVVGNVNYLTGTLIKAAGRTFQANKTDAAMTSYTSWSQESR